jgi:hypothetical protein
VSGSERYGRLDRFLHRLAFRLPLAQRTLAEVEERLYAVRLRDIRPGPPVFITSLPRAGTTILLRLLWKSGAFASTIYRDMPFVMCPLLWNRFARGFSADDTPVERDHGDGLLISGTSPEGFEEVLWKHFWPDHYLEDRILPWTETESRPEFERFFEMHVRKVLALRREDGPGRTRYVSKNNLNIARLGDDLPAPLRHGTILVPFRAPLQQAASMLQQHERFTALHDDDPFLLEYMEAIGHHEFGRGLKPVDFGGWLDRTHESPGDLVFWLRYWVAAYRNLLTHSASHVTFMSYRRLTSAPEDALRRLAAVVGIDAEVLTWQAGRVHPPRSHEVAEEEFPAALLEEAEELHGRLEALSYL